MQAAYVCDTVKQAGWRAKRANKTPSQDRTTRATPTEISVISVSLC